MKTGIAKWIGPASWAAKEARAGDRLPYAAALGDQVLRLRDGALMVMIQVPGLPFETEDADALDHHLGVRETMLRSVLDARFMLYHHVVRRRIAVARARQDGLGRAAEASFIRRS